MLNNDQGYVCIGHTRKAHGLTGEIKVSIEDQYLEDFLKNERVFIAIKSSKIPYFIANIRGKGEMIVQLEEVDNRDTAQLLQSREIFLRQQDILTDKERELEIPDDSLEYEHLAGYMIVDQSLGEIGTIDEILEMPQQEMAFLRYKNREVLIPMNEHFIVSIDEKGKVVQMDLPEGLLS